MCSIIITTVLLELKLNIPEGLEGALLTLILMETGLTVSQGPHFYAQLPSIPLIFSSDFTHNPVESLNPEYNQVSVLFNRDCYTIIETDGASMVFTNIWRHPNAVVLKG